MRSCTTLFHLITAGGIW